MTLLNPNSVLSHTPRPSTPCHALLCELSRAGLHWCMLVVGWRWEISCAAGMIDRVVRTRVSEAVR